MNGPIEFQLRKRLAAWSDRRQGEVVCFADARRDLLPRWISSAQLHGLANVVGSARSYGTIRRFVDHRAEKAERAERAEARAYWADLRKEFDRLKDEAQDLLRQAPLSPGEEHKTVLDALHCQLVGVWVRHLVAHSFFWTPEDAGGGHSRKRV